MLKSDFLKMLEFAARLAKSNELLSVPIGSAVLELVVCIWLHVLEHLQSKFEPMLKSDFLEMLE